MGEPIAARWKRAPRKYALWYWPDVEHVSNVLIPVLLQVLIRYAFL